MLEGSSWARANGWDERKWFCAFRESFLISTDDLRTVFEPLRNHHLETRRARRDIASFLLSRENREQLDAVNRSRAVNILFSNNYDPQRRNNFFEVH